MKTSLWIIGYTLAALLGMVGAGAIGIIRSAALIMAPAPAASAAVVPRPAPRYDADKPTVAVLLGNTRTEATDFLTPYAMFAESGAYNVYAVAESRAVRTLAGGVDVVPQFSFAELAARLLHRPDIIVVPAMTAIGSPDNAPVLRWLRENGRDQTILFSWCAGAEVLAASGLIDGKTVTTHWGDIDTYERAYPAVTWQRGVRYLDAGTLVTTGGITAGVDATLHLLARLNGQVVADTVAQALHYPGSPFVTNPQMPQYTLKLVDSTVLLNLAYSWPKPQTGVWLYDGVGEADLAAAVEAYQLSSTEHTSTMAAGPAVVSQHGVQLVPRLHGSDWPAMERVIVPGGAGAHKVAQNLPEGLVRRGTQLSVLQNDQAPTYAFTLALEDLAATHDVPTAVHTARQLEVRSPLHLVGSRWPLHLLVIPVLAGLAGCVALWCLTRLSRRAFGFLRAQRLARAVPPLRST